MPDTIAVRLHMDSRKVIEQANKIAELILYDKPSSTESKTPTDELRKFQTDWVRWVIRSGVSGELEGLIERSYLQFLNETHKEDFEDVLTACKSPKGDYPSISLRTLISLMDSEKGKAVIKRLGLDCDPTFSASEFFNSGMGTRLEEYINGNYGIEVSGENAVDAADLLHAAFFDRLSKASDCHLVPKVISDYLSSSGRGGQKGVFMPNGPELDSVLAFYNSYDDKKVIEDVIFDIERRKVFSSLAELTMPRQRNVEEYRAVLRQGLDDLVENLRTQRSQSQLEGTKSILGRLIERYSALRDFSLDNVSPELDGWAFPRFYQAEAVLDIFRNKRFLVADEMGTGKTAISVLASEYIGQQKGRDARTLVITTTTNKAHFAEKIKRYVGFSDEDAEDAIVCINGRDRASQYEHAKGARYVVINYELLRAKDWRIQDYKSWKVDDEKYVMLRAQIDASYGQSRRSISKFEFVMNRIPKIVRDRIQGHVGDDLDQAMDACIKIMDLNEAKSVYSSLKRENNFDHVIVDEVQNGKRESSLNAKAILSVTKDVEYVACLSGTPFVNGLSDLGIIFTITGVYDDMVTGAEKKLAELEQELGVARNPLAEKSLPSDARKVLKSHRKSIAKLKSSIENGDVKSILLSNPRMIRDYLRPKMVRRRSKQVLGIPDIRFDPHINRGETDLESCIVLPMYQRMAYEILQSHDFGNCSDQLRALQMFLLSPGLYTHNFTPARNPMGDIIGFMPVMPFDVDVHLTDENSLKYEKLEALIEKVMTDPSKRKKNVVVFSSHYKKGVTEYIEERLKQRFAGYNIMRIDGDIVDIPKSMERKRRIDLFNKSEEPSVMIATLPTMKEAVELHAECSSVIFLDLPFTWAEYAQGYSRVWRGDQDEPVDVYNLIIDNSLDLGKLMLISDKRMLGEFLMQGRALTKEEMDTLDLTDSNIGDYPGFVEEYIHRTTNDSMKVMRDLYGAGKDKIREFLGERTKASTCYADAYIINVMSESSVLGIMSDMRVLGLLDFDDLGSLDGKVLDIAAGYGRFAHITGIKSENLEINPVMIERAADYSPSANYTQGVMQDVHDVYGDDRFECVISSLSFHYSSDEERGQLLYDIHRTMKQGGYLFLTDSLASIDEEGRQKLEEVAEYTGFIIVECGEVNVNGKEFYRLIVQKTGEANLYSEPFALRTFEDGIPEDYDPNRMEDNKEELKTMFAPDSEGVLGWQRPQWAEKIRKISEDGD